MREEEMLREKERKRKLKELKKYSRFDEKHEVMRETEVEKQR